MTYGMENLKNFEWPGNSFGAENNKNVHTRKDLKIRYDSIESQNLFIS